MDALLQLDLQLFYLINSDWTTPFLDAVLTIWRNKYFWTPLYLFIASFLVINFKWKGALVIVFALLTITVSDLTSSKAIKKTVKRYRPCKDPAVKDTVRLLVKCGGKYSFTSSHATNHFAQALFLIGIFTSLFKWVRIPLLMWAATISYAQVYVGVHYPLDVICGGIVGALIGWVIYLLYKWIAIRLGLLLVP